MTLVACIALSGCSSLSKDERQQAAQRKQLRKAREARMTEQKKIIANKNRALATPTVPGAWSTNVTLDPVESPEPAAPENTPAGN